MFSFIKKYRQDYADTLKLAIPLIATLWAQMGMEIIDTLMLGQLGTDALAAGGLGTAMFIILFVPMVGFIAAVGILIARAYGRRDYQDAVFNFQQGVWLGVGLAIPCMLVMWVAPHLLVPLGYSEELAYQAKQYLHMLMWAMLPGMLIVTLREFIAAFSMPRLLFYSSLSALPLNVLGNYLLMHGIWIFPEMGAAGIGLATALCDYYLCGLLLLVVAYHHSFKDIQVFARLHWPSRAVLNEVFRIGGPISMSISIEVCLFASTTFFMGVLDPAALAGHNIAVNLQPFMFMVPYGLSQATAIRVGHAMGADKPHLVRQIGISSYHLGLTAGTLIMALYLLGGLMLVGLFLDLNNPEYQQSVTFAVTFLIIAAFIQWPDVMNVVSQGGLRGLKDTKAPMKVLFICHWCIGFPLVIILGFHTPLGPQGIWIGLVIAVALASIFNTRRFLRTSARLSC